MTQPLPSGLKYGTVRWRTVGPTVDSADLGNAPDAEQINGVVRFKANISTGRLKWLGDGVDTTPRTVLMGKPIEYQLVNGVIVDGDSDTDIQLVASSGQTPGAVSPADGTWNWHVEFELDDDYTFGEFDFDLPADEVTDLTLVIPEVAEDGEAYITGPIGPQGPPPDVDGTSASSLVVGTGPQIIETQAGIAFSVGQYLRVARTSAPTTYMAGPVTSYSGTTLVLDAVESQGAGTFTDWTISISGRFGTGVPPGGATGQVIGHDGISPVWEDTTNLATASVLIRRDAAGRAKVVDGAVAADIATKGQMDAASTADRARANHTGTQSLDTTTDSATRLAMTAAERTKLAGVATGATANSTDAFLLARANHTGTQLASTISDLTETVQDIVAAFLVAGTNVTVAYDDVANTFTINATGGGGGTDAEIVRDTIAGALVAGSGIQITVDDPLDTITIASTAVLPTRQIIAGTGLSGGGDLSANRTLAVVYGTTASTSAEGNHTHTPSQVGLGNVDNTSDVNKPVSTAQQAEIDASANLTATNAQTGTTYTYVLADRRRVTTLSNAGAITATVPPNSSVAYAVGTVLKSTQTGAGQVTFAQGAGVTINTPTGRNLKTRAQNSVVYLIKTGTDSWYAFGDLEWASMDAATTEIVQDIVGAMFTDSTGIDFTYNDAGATETLAIAAASTTASGIVELADDTEAAAQTSNAVVMTPARTKIARRQAITARTTAHTAAAADVEKLITMTHAATAAVTLPSDANDAGILVGDWIEYLQLGAGQTTFTAGAGVSALVVPTGASASCRGVNCRVVVQKIAANTYALAGDLT